LPQYIYQCKNCNREITVTCKMSQYCPTAICDVCGESVERKVEDLVCGLSIDTTGDFYRKTN